MELPDLETQDVFTALFLTLKLSPSPKEELQEKWFTRRYKKAPCFFYRHLDPRLTSTVHFKKWWEESLVSSTTDISAPCARQRRILDALGSIRHETAQSSLNE